MKKLIGFVTAGLQFNGNSLNEKALGGSESAMIYMAREIAACGNNVTVYCDCDKPGNYDGVTYAPIETFLQIRHKMFDVLIVSRHLEVLCPNHISNLTIFWMHDTYSPIVGARIQLQDQIFLLSEYHKELWVEENKWYKDMVHLTTNGFDKVIADQFCQLEHSDRKNAYIYSSRPERGLKFLLKDLWPRVLEINPDAVLHICSYANPVADESPQVKDLYDEIEELVKNTPKVVKLGHLNKRQYYQALSQCGYMVYPCDYPEISCINAIEAQAMGCLVITSDAFALSETVKSDTKVKGDTAEEYNDAFIAKVKEYQDPEKWTAETKKVRDIIHAEYPWSAIAKNWDAKFDAMFEERFEKNKAKVIRRLGHNSDYVTASLFDDSYKGVLEAIKAQDYSYTYQGPDGSGSVPEDCNEIQPSGRHRLMIDRVADFLKAMPEGKKATVIDFGCHDGAISGNLYKENPDRIEKMVAFDGFPSALAGYVEIWGKNEECSNIHTICDDVMNLKKYPDLKADVIIAGEILEHVVEYKAFLEELNKHANPGALVILSTPIGPWSSISLKIERRADGSRKTFHDDYHVHHFELMDLLTMFENFDNEKNQFFVDACPSYGSDFRNETVSNHIFGYYNNAPAEFKEYDPVLKAKKTRPYQSLSTIMMVRNEENYLFKCLNSVKSISDEIIIVDTGSTDHTKYIASQFTDKVYDLKWEEEDGVGSFERARNYGLDKATGDFILYIDADEELMNGQYLMDMLRTEYVHSFMILQHQITANEIKAPDQIPNRLFRKDKFRFYGIIHELPKQSINEDNDICELLLPQEIRLDHYGYMSNQVNMAKLYRNHELLLKHIKKYPDQPDGKYYHLRDMVHFYDFTQQPEFLREALQLWKDFTWDVSSARRKDFWLSAFHDMQRVFVALEDLGELTPIKKKINKKRYPFVTQKQGDFISNNAEYRFLTEKEARFFKKLNEHRIIPNMLKD